MTRTETGQRSALLQKIRKQTTALLWIILLFLLFLQHEWLLPVLKNIF